MAIGGLGGFLADAVAQRFTPVTLSKSGGSAPTEPPPFDVMRSLRFAAFGGLLGAPLSHFYYGALDKAIFADAPHAPRTILTKIAIDQLIWSPITSLAFLAGLRTLEGRPDLVQASLETSFLPLIKAQWTVWPLAHAINFRFVPTEQRVRFFVCRVDRSCALRSFPFGTGVVSVMNHTCMINLQSFPHNLSPLRLTSPPSPGPLRERGEPGVHGGRLDDRERQAGGAAAG